MGHCHNFFLTWWEKANTTQIQRSLLVNLLKFRPISNYYSYQFLYSAVVQRLIPFFQLVSFSYHQGLILLLAINSLQRNLKAAITVSFLLQSRVFQWEPYVQSAFYFERISLKTQETCFDIFVHYSTTFIYAP